MNFSIKYYPPLSNESMNFNSYRENWYDLMLFPWLVPTYRKEISTFFKIEPNPCIVFIEWWLWSFQAILSHDWHILVVIVTTDYLKMTTSWQWASQKWPHFENPIVNAITTNKKMPVMMSHLNNNSIYFIFNCFHMCLLSEFFLSNCICLNKRWFISGCCKRRYEIGNLNFGSFSRHILCSSRK